LRINVIPTTPKQIPKLSDCHRNRFDRASFWRCHIHDRLFKVGRPRAFRSNPVPRNAGGFPLQSLPLGLWAGWRNPNRFSRFSPVWL